VYFVSSRSLNSSRESEFGDSGHCRISTSDVSNSAAVAAHHYHPGDEAIYMLQGSLLFEPDQGQPFELKAG
jgi:hypothetical protein